MPIPGLHSGRHSGVQALWAWGMEEAEATEVHLCLKSTPR
jgi:hypothetical protein